VKGDRPLQPPNGDLSVYACCYMHGLRGCGCGTSLVRAKVVFEFAVFDEASRCLEAALAEIGAVTRRLRRKRRTGVKHRLRVLERRAAAGTATLEQLVEWERLRRRFRKRRNKKT
jgi:hypothetical protein